MHEKRCLVIPRIASRPPPRSSSCVGFRWRNRAPAEPVCLSRVEKRAEGREGSDCKALHRTAEQGLAEGGEGSHATPSDADEPRGRETIRSKEDSAHTVDKLSCFSNHNCRTWNPGLVSVVYIEYCDKSGLKSSWLGVTVECIGGIGGLAGWVGWKYEAGSGISVGTAHLLVGLHTHTT